jgi:hypothetical protein
LSDNVGDILTSKKALRILEQKTAIKNKTTVSKKSTKKYITSKRRYSFSSSTSSESETEMILELNYCLKKKTDNENQKPDPIKSKLGPM